MYNIGYLVQCATVCYSVLVAQNRVVFCNDDKWANLKLDEEGDVGEIL